MGFARKRNNRRVEEALRPYNYSDPFGRVDVDSRQKTIRVTPVDANRSVDQYLQSNQKISDLIGGLPTRMSAEDLFDNPFYQSTRTLLRNPIQAQQETDRRELSNRLSALNQTRNAFGALQEDLLDRRYQQLFQSAESQARQTSADNFLRSLDSRLNILQGLRNDQSQLMGNLSSIGERANRFQSSLSGLQQEQANSYRTQGSIVSDIAMAAALGARMAGKA